MANYLPTVLKGSARTWLVNLPKGSVYSWEELCDVFQGNFQGTYKRPRKKQDLYHIAQLKKETLREYIERFCKAWNDIPDVTDDDVIRTFIDGCLNKRCVQDVTIRKPTTVKELMKIADQCADAEEAV